MPDEQTGDDVQTLQGGQELMIEVDGKMVPNYDATIMTFEEGDIVTGTVVRVDKDEVLVDIGYKSEGVVPANELSIRKSVDPSEEVSVGDVVDALVLTKEDADGRLILSRRPIETVYLPELEKFNSTSAAGIDRLSRKADMRLFRQ